MTYKRSPERKFLYVSLAMLSSKGPSAEDKMILRKMRLDRGGVVDLAQEEMKKTGYKVKKVKQKRNLGRGTLKTNPKFREKAAKIIQSWWRELKEKYNDYLRKIVLIQSCWRGKWIRKYMYDMLYLNFLYVSFCQNIENALKRHILQEIFNKLRGSQINKDSILSGLLLIYEKHHSSGFIKYWNKWKNLLKLSKGNKFRALKLAQVAAELQKSKLFKYKYFILFKEETSFTFVLLKSKYFILSLSFNDIKSEIGLLARLIASI